MTPICVREAIPADVPALQGLFAEVDRLHWEQQPDVFREVSGPTREGAYLRALITDWRAGVIVAEMGTVLVGCLVIRIQETRDIPILVVQRYAIVDTIVVGPAYRREGVGRRLMACAEGWAQARDIGRIELNVFEFNAGVRRFYEELGYSTLSRRMVKRLDGK